MAAKTRSYLSFIVLAILLLAFGLGLVYRQNIYDWWRLRGYSPPARIEKIAQKTTMTGDGTRFFYVNHPEISNSQVFNDKCRINEFSIILGCYISNDGIYLFDINDKRLEGIVEVTAAHEMLHAAYERLSGGEKDRVDNLLQQAFSDLDDARINSTIKQYRDQDPTSVNNELHSILATEVRDLPSELEEYYRIYFKDRLAVVSLSESYEREFSSRQAQTQQIEAQLQGLRAEIDNNQSNINESNASIQSQKSQLDELLANNQINQYNSQVDEFNQDVNEYNALVVSTRSQIDQYNNLVNKYQTISLEINDLYKSINSQPQTL